MCLHAIQLDLVVGVFVNRINALIFDAQRRLFASYTK